MISIGQLALGLGWPPEYHESLSVGYHFLSKKAIHVRFLPMVFTHTPHLGAIMALLILTGQHEAIKLEGLHGEQVLMLDKAAVDTKEGCPGNALWLIGLRGGVLQFLRILSTTRFYPLKPKRMPTA